MYSKWTAGNDCAVAREALRVCWHEKLPCLAQEEEEGAKMKLGAGKNERCNI